jgi:hypothetical protein
MRLSALLGPRFDVDFCARRARVPPLAWLLLVAGLICVASALADLVPRWRRLDRLSAQRAAVELQIQQLSGGIVPSHAASTADLAEARTVLGDLSRPWKPLFDRFESVDGPKVHLVQLAVDSHFQGMQVLAEASRLDDVLQYSQKLAGDGLVRSVRLTHHEWRAASGTRVVVANLTAELSRVDRASAGSAR